MRPLARALACVAVAAASVSWPIDTSAAQRGGDGSANPDRYVILGCVSREPSAGRGTPTFIVTDTRGEKPIIYRLNGDAAALDFQVGHYVEVAGPLASPAGGASARGLVMKVERLTYLSKECPASKPRAK
jgi:hypothetical protein